MKIRGWIYVITNKAMPKLVKIGYSTKDPWLRAQEFDGTGAPHPFEVIYDALVIEPREVEQKVHSLLNDKREKKEWFCCSIEEAIRAIRTVVGSEVMLENTTNTQILQESIIQSRFTEDSGRTVIDQKTGLMWAAEDNGRDIDWQAANFYCKTWAKRGYRDWRMPTQNELALLYNELILKDKEIIRISNWLLWTSKSRGLEAAYLVLSIFLCEIFIGQFFKERQIFTHFSNRG